jgi:hypothetical protein
LAFFSLEISAEPVAYRPRVQYRNGGSRKPSANPAGFRHSIRINEEDRNDCDAKVVPQQRPPSSTAANYMMNSTSNFLLQQQQQFGGQRENNQKRFAANNNPPSPNSSSDSGLCSGTFINFAKKLIK